MVAPLSSSPPSFSFTLSPRQLILILIQLVRTIIASTLLSQPALKGPPSTQSHASLAYASSPPALLLRDIAPFGL